MLKQLVSNIGIFAQELKVFYGMGLLTPRTTSLASMLENILGGMVLNSNVNSMISPWLVFKMNWKIIMRYHVVHSVLFCSCNILNNILSHHI